MELKPPPLFLEPKIWNFDREGRFFFARIAKALRAVDPQTMEQPCGCNPRPILGGVDEPYMKPEPAIVAHLGPIETPAADLISHCLTLSAEFSSTG